MYQSRWKAEIRKQKAEIKVGSISAFCFLLSTFPFSVATAQAS